ncbi:hypothetical protein H9P43_004461 [Blastocladiella emersonii ATCC 22665]|nr:hypothetical protein H9P43_004461 [Blastocladiella emersonii ATCC 22665]
MPPSPSHGPRRGAFFLTDGDSADSDSASPSSSSPVPAPPTTANRSGPRIFVPAPLLHRLFPSADDESDNEITERTPKRQRRASPVVSESIDLTAASSGSSAASSSSSLPRVVFSSSPSRTATSNTARGGPPTLAITTSPPAGNSSSSSSGSATSTVHGSHQSHMFLSSSSPARRAPVEVIDLLDSDDEDEDDDVEVHVRTSSTAASSSPDIRMRSSSGASEVVTVLDSDDDEITVVSSTIRQPTHTHQQRQRHGNVHLLDSDSDSSDDSNEVRFVGARQVEPRAPVPPPIMAPGQNLFQVTQALRDNIMQAARAPPGGGPNFADLARQRVRHEEQLRGEAQRRLRAELDAETRRAQAAAQPNFLQFGVGGNAWPGLPTFLAGARAYFAAAANRAEFGLNFNLGRPMGDYIPDDMLDGMTYEEIVELTDRVSNRSGAAAGGGGGRGDAPAPGMRPAEISQLPETAYKKPRPGTPAAEAEDCCAICQDEYKAGDKVLTIPGCNHFTHSTCIKPWLQRNATCPMCRASVRDAIAQHAAAASSSSSAPRNRATWAGPSGPQHPPLPPRRSQGAGAGSGANAAAAAAAAAAASAGAARRRPAGRVEVVVIDD